MRVWIHGRAIQTVSTIFLVATLCCDAQSDDETIVWQSRNDTFTALTKEFAGLYNNLLAILAKGGSIPTTTVTVSSGNTITEVLRAQRLFDGKDLPRQLDILVCMQNPRLCKVTPGKSGDVRADDATATWKIQPNDDIVVPDIRFEQVILHKPYQKNAGDTLKNIVVDVRQGCDTFDDACQKYIQNLNRRVDKPIDRDYSGKIVVPTKAYRAVIPIESPWTQKELMKGLPAMEGRVIPPAEATLHDDTSAMKAAAPPEADRERLLTLIHHPLAKTDRLDLPGTAHATVAVFDSWVDPAHCMFSSIKVLDPENLAMAVQRAATCGERGSAIAPTDHGTHVVGLIGTRVGVKGGPGVNPYATIEALCMDMSQFKLPVYLAKQSDRLRALYRTDPPDVVNLSFEYNLTAEQGRNDVFLAAIKELASDTLFVASAGNDKLNLSRTGECRVRPACFDEPNVVTVAALNLDGEAPDLLASTSGGSNFGDRVHLGAPGQNILSTISGDRIGVLGGTSQAAPAVAGAASLLYLYVSKLQAPQVKNRLIYTSDLYSNLYDKMLGGRVNVTRLLAYNRALVDTKDGHHVEAIKRLPETLVRFIDFQSNESFALHFSQIRRLMYNRDLNYYTLFYNDELGRDTGILRRRFVMFANSSVRISFAVPQPSGAERREEISVGNIIDYVSPLLL